MQNVASKYKRTNVSIGTYDFHILSFLVKIYNLCK